SACKLARSQRPNPTRCDHDGGPVNQRVREQGQTDGHHETMSTMRHGVRVGRCRTSILCATWIERTDALSNVPRTEAIRTGRARQINAGPGLSYRIPALRQQAAPLPPSSPDCCKPAIPATGRPILPKTVERGTFREDLFYRLNVFAILIAPLRERADEILRPSAVFLQEIAHAVGPPPAGLTTHAREALL